ncbi:hypothetical protein JoomaDRAFT_0014 [Galbibacter orientalis DSM 19592]|uniref:Uncharacterized protein n=1 Tax=Galbibacter orientalis DSM 19592 TaxID=926559 RepID=I3C0D8_9FLAO|nr:hypothetical protein [Galbibacter orientalis]EIJ37081.1 hypothetical protein JoomaDRAFT_0014 [Galbibacter orientalis DSM 19592]
MQVQIVLNGNESTSFPINMSELEQVLQSCELGIGTSYKPIEIDDFIYIRNTFPEIKENTTIELSLKKEARENHLEIKLICVKVVNIGITFNQRKGINNDNWNKIFDCDQNNVLFSPDGILYVKPDPSEICRLKTKSPENSFLSYSILFSAEIKDPNHNELKKEYFFIIDPLIKVSSGVGI